jgi:hypothetical protein
VKWLPSKDNARIWLNHWKGTLPPHLQELPRLKLTQIVRLFVCVCLIASCTILTSCPSIQVNHQLKQQRADSAKTLKVACIRYIKKDTLRQLQAQTADFAFVSDDPESAFMTVFNKKNLVADLAEYTWLAHVVRNNNYCYWERCFLTCSSTHCRGAIIFCMDPRKHYPTLMNRKPFARSSKQQRKWDKSLVSATSLG